MMKKDNKLKFIVTVLICFAFAYFLIIYPIQVFRGNENKLKDAAARYFELNPSQLPTGERIKTVALKELYHEKFLETDIYAPYSKKTCSVENSWVKVRKENEAYRYYVYLDCGGALHSFVDHKGPEITLNGKKYISIGLGEDFTDPGVNRVVDAKDGKIDLSNVIVKGKVDNQKVGTYEITYTAFDQLSNKTVVTRKVEVVQKLYDTIATKLNGTRNFVGNPDNHYVQLSNMLFRVFGVNEDNDVILVADEDVANVNYSKLDKWLDYYYQHLNSNAQKMIVDSQFCNVRLSENNLDTTQCNAYTKKRKIYIPSVVEVNKAAAGDENFMKPATMSWIANSKTDNQAYVTRDIFFDQDYGKSFLPYSVYDNYGVRPMLVIKGSSLITDGDGTRTNPYLFGDSKKGASGSLLSKRNTGEYVTSGGMLWRIIDTFEDGTVKVVSVSTLSSPSSVASCYPDPDNSKILYNPEDKMSIGYYINNKSSDYIDSKDFVNHVIEVPIYKNKIIFGEEVKTVKYNVMFSAPNMYEMFSAQVRNLVGYYPHSYWLVNSSNGNRIAGAITDIGVPINEKIEEYYASNVRVVGFMKKGLTISSGDGTEILPYKVK